MNQYHDPILGPVDLSRVFCSELLAITHIQVRGRDLTV